MITYTLSLPRADTWTIKDQVLRFRKTPLIMGILNVTPDSFSDGGNYYTVQAAVDRAKQLEDAGADMIDIGGESTRPYSQPVDQADEVQRIAPVLERLQGAISIPISIDTTKASVARVAIDLGAKIINDVSGLEADEQMIDVARETQAGICAMHRQGTPQNMQDNPSYENCTLEILEYLRQRDTSLSKAGIAPERICLDPGIGFGKSHQHNLELIRSVGLFHQLGRPLLVGHSRKGFIGKILGDKDLGRDYGTLGVSFALQVQGVQILRVHDVAGHVQAFRLLESC
ncbi:MAG: dihydropteroate synthase [Planctomycetota bacterium]|jgi:dihydropteroate synthase|nr:dihydropteroate synthase [Planctomycetaceae bacterium]MCE2814663.1 dihydropteroate synthase [Planctomycetaceae bacterium]